MKLIPIPFKLRHLCSGDLKELEKDVSKRGRR